MTEFVFAMTSGFVPRFLLVLSLFLAGLQVTSRIDREPKTMGRFLYGLIVLSTAALWNGAPGLWLAVSSSNVDAASWSYLTLIAFCALLLAFAARRRSVDAYGDPRNAYLAAIPLISLVLVFKGPSTTRTAERSGWAVLGRSIAFIVLGVAVMIPGLSLGTFTQTKIRPNIADLPPHRAMRLVAMMNDAAAPAVLDKYTVLSRCDYH